MNTDAPAPQRVRRVALVACVSSDDAVLAQARNRAIAGFEAGGHEVRLLNLIADGFDPIVNADQWAAHAAAGLPDGLAGTYAETVMWSDTLVFVYPTIWGGQPALLKGWLDRVFTNGVAYDIVPGASRISGRLKQIDRIMVITTYSTKRWRSRLHGEPGKKVMKRGVRALCGLTARSSWLALHGVQSGRAGTRSFAKRSLADRSLAKQSDWFDTIEQTAQSL